MSEKTPEELLAEAKAYWTTEIIDIHPGQIRVRGYEIQDLIGKISFPQMIWLMLRGDLPTPQQAKLLEARLAVWTRSVGIDHTADSREVAGLEFRDGGANLCHPADDFVTGHDRIDAGHEAAPFIPNLVKIGVAHSAEQNFDLDVVCIGIAPPDSRGGER